jgi:hypothetical protein
MKFLKKITVADILFFVVLLALCFAIFYTCNHTGAINKDAGVQNVKEVPVTYYRDKKGIDHAEKPVAVLNNKQVDQHYQYIIDSLIKLIPAKKKNIETITDIALQTKGSFEPTISYKILDTCVSKYPESVVYEDKWLSLKGDIATKKFTYSIKDSITAVTYKKRVSLFKKELYENIFSSNPNAVISGITSVKIDQAKPIKFGIGLQIGYSWNGSSFKPTVGIGVSYNIIRF